MEHWHAHNSRANDNGILSFVLQDRLRVGMFLQLAGLFYSCMQCLSSCTGLGHVSSQTSLAWTLCCQRTSKLAACASKPSLSGACQNLSCLACHSVDLLYIMHCFQARKELGSHIRPVEESIADGA